MSPPLYLCLLTRQVLDLLAHALRLLQVPLVELPAERRVDLGHDGRVVAARATLGHRGHLHVGQVAHEAQHGDPDGQRRQLIALRPQRQQRLLQRLLRVLGRRVALEVGGRELGEDVLVQVLVHHRTRDTVHDEFTFGACKKKMSNKQRAREVSNKAARIRGC